MDVVNTDPDERVVLVDLDVQAVDREGRLDQYTDRAGLLVKGVEHVAVELAEDLRAEHDVSLSRVPASDLLSLADALIVS